MRRVLFLGAGASAPFGVPKTSRILPLAIQNLPNLFGVDQEDRDFFREGLRAFYPGIDLNGTDEGVPNITEVLSMLDFLISGNQPAKPRWDIDKMTRLRTLFDRAIAEVLGTPAMPSPELFHFIRALSAEGNHLTVITTNYDLILDSVLGRVVNGSSLGLQQIDIGFSYRDVGNGKLMPRPSSKGLPGRLALFKLHGSLNYLRCEVCDQIYVNHLGDISHLAFVKRAIEENSCHCGNGPLRVVIVAPSSVRVVRTPQILGIWAAATEALRTADEWIFAGYSLPAEDLAIRSMLFRAWHARGQHRQADLPVDEWPFRDPPKVLVIQQGDAAKAAYRLLFGEQPYYEHGFEQWLFQNYPVTSAGSDQPPPDRAPQTQT